MRIVIVGSGPVGAAYARILWTGLPRAEISMIETGPVLTSVRGENVRNLASDSERSRARLASQGPVPDHRMGRAIPSGTVAANEITARQGTHLLSALSSADCSSMPAAAMSTCVGGQGAHWTCACPRPSSDERMTSILPPSWEASLAEAEQLLHVKSNAFQISREGNAIRQALARALDPELPASRRVSILPVAADVTPEGILRWAGTDTVLGPLSSGREPRFEILSETLCRRLRLESDRVIGVELEDLYSGKRRSVDADLTVVAADAFRTPQLLWASGIRPRALGRYLTEHPGVLGFVRLQDELIPERIPVAQPEPTDPVTAAVHVPYSDAHPFSGQIMFSRTLPIGPGIADGGYATLAWWCRKFPRAADGLVFSEDAPDLFGMPSIGVKYALTEIEDREVARARAFVVRVADVLGKIVPGGEPRVLPSGSSLHYQGTYRVGPSDDGTSVCDSYSRVWGLTGLILGGNGLIGSATACNPTLTSLALAVRGARRFLHDCKVDH